MYHYILFISLTKFKRKVNNCSFLWLIQLVVNQINNQKCNLTNSVHSNGSYLAILYLHNCSACPISILLAALRSSTTVIIHQVVDHFFQHYSSSSSLSEIFALFFRLTSAPPSSESLCNRNQCLTVSSSSLLLVHPYGTWWRLG